MRPPARPRVTALPGDARPAPRPARPVGEPALPPAEDAVVTTPPSAGRPAPTERPDDRPATAPVRTGVAPRSWAPVRPPVVSDALSARVAERAAHRRRLTRDRALVSSAVAVVVGALGWLLLLSPVLALDASRVQIEGQGTVVDPAAVAAVVAPHAGTPLPRLDTVALRREVLDVPGVRAAEVTRLWPHGLRIEVVSREPVAAVPQEGGGVTLLDVDGVQVGRADAAPAGLPVVQVPLEDDGARTLGAVLAVLQQLPDDLAPQVVGVSAENQDTVTLTLADGIVVEWGSADQTALKARVLQTLRASAAAGGVRVYDVSAPTLPITRS